MPRNKEFSAIEKLENLKAGTFNYYQFVSMLRKVFSTRIVMKVDRDESGTVIYAVRFHKDDTPNAVQVAYACRIKLGEENIQFEVCADTSAGWPVLESPIYPFAKIRECLLEIKLYLAKSDLRTKSLYKINTERQWVDIGRIFSC